MLQEVKVCVFAGHSGGHLFPALAFAERFKERFPESKIFLITSPKARGILKSHGAVAFDQITFLNEFPLPAGISLRTFTFLLEFARAFLLSYSTLTKLKPDFCVGFGSYVSYPGMRIAAFKKIPTLIHEQNKIAGKATQLLVSHVDRVAVSFDQTFRPNLSKQVVSGLPLRTKLYQSRDSFRRSFTQPTPQKPLNILIVGGSQGAHRLNEIILQSFSLLLPEERQKIAVTHSTGTQDFEWVTETYRRLEMSYKTFPFYENMQQLYREADLAITRAGANTLFELALFGLPAITVPYPHAAENHQEANARHFESRGAMVVMPERELRAEALTGKIREFFAPEIRFKISEQLNPLAPEDAAVKLVDIACELLPAVSFLHKRPLENSVKGDA